MQKRETRNIHILYTKGNCKTRTTLKCIKQICIDKDLYQKCGLKVSKTCSKISIPYRDKIVRYEPPAVYEENTCDCKRASFSTFFLFSSIFEPFLNLCGHNLALPWPPHRRIRRKRRTTTWFLCLNQHSRLYFPNTGKST